MVALSHDVTCCHDETLHCSDHCTLKVVLSGLRTLSIGLSLCMINCGYEQQSKATHSALYL
jgi:hypothetical protein